MSKKEEVKDTKGKSEATSKDESAAPKSASSRLANNPEMSEGLKDVLEDKSVGEDLKSEDQTEVVVDTKNAEESKEDKSEAKSEGDADTIEAELSEILAEEAKTAENKDKEKEDKEDPSERSDRNIQKEIQRKVKQEMERFEGQWKKEHGLDEPPPQQDPEAVREMLRNRYPKLYDTLGEDVIKDIFTFNQNQYDEVFKPTWEKDQFDKSNKVTAEKEARNSIVDKPYYKTLKPLIDKLEDTNPVVKQLSGKEKFEYLYDKAFSMLAPKLIQKKLQGMQKQVKEKHTVLPEDEVIKEVKTEKKASLNSLSDKERHFAEKHGLTDDDLNNPLYTQGGTVIDIDR